MRGFGTATPHLAWRLILLALLLLAGALFLVVLHIDAGFLPGGMVQFLVGILLTGSWLVTIYFLLLDTWGRWWWFALNIVSIVFVVTVGFAGTITGLVFSSFFLTARRYAPWRLVPDRRRAAGFGLGLLALTALFFVRRFWEIDSDSPLVELAKHLGGWSLGSLTMFWLWSLFHLALRMRLHFLRLRPKLAVSAFLIGVVPLLLVILLGVMILYTGLGGARAVRARETLESWRQLTDQGADMGTALFDSTFTWAKTGSAGPALATDVDPPAHVSRLARELQIALKYGSRDSTGVARTDTTDWVFLDGGIWLMKWRDLDGDLARVRGWKLNRRPLMELSRILMAGVDISPINVATQDGDVSISTGSPEEWPEFPGLKVSYRDIAEDSPFWDQFMFFGGTLFPLLKFTDGGLRDSSVFINLKVGWPDIKAEFFEGDSNLNIAVVVSLAVLAFLFLVLEVFAVFFGIRISEGIVSAVHVLHRGTQALASGDLDTRISVPNEDEFGDLAGSFNEMTLAIKHGREVALANERLKRELETARGIQERLLPAGEPTLNGFEVTGASIPSREIGGDYFDFLVLGEDQVGIAIGDVSGKGMPAAMLMSNLQASLHGQVLHPGSVSGVVERVNDLIVKSTDPHMFATFFYGLLDTRTSQMTCTNAGHNPPVLLRSDGTLEELTTGGLLLGMLGDQVYQQAVVTMEPGDVVVMYTDGITEAVGPGAGEDDHEAMFGEDALFDVLRRSRHLPANGIKDAILDAVAAHTAGEAQSDDITLVVVRKRD